MVDRISLLDIGVFTFCVHDLHFLEVDILVDFAELFKDKIYTSYWGYNFYVDASVKKHHFN